LIAPSYPEVAIPMIGGSWIRERTSSSGRTVKLAGLIW